MLDVQTIRQRVASELSTQLTASERGYKAQRVYTALMFDMIGRLLEAASAVDLEIQREVRGFPAGYTIGFSVLGETLGMRVQRKGERLVRVSPSTKPELEITFKHLSHAFLVLSFQESTAEAFAHGRAITQGDIALAMRFVRCLNRMQAVALPRLIAERALKALPTFAPLEKTMLSSKLYGQLAVGLVRSHS